MYDGVTRNAYHLYMFRYDAGQFAGLPREKFIKAMHAEGVPCSAGYTPLNKEPFMEATLNSRAFKKIYSEKELASLRERNNCPENDKLCNEEALWLEQTTLLGHRTDMEQIAEAIRKIQSLAGELTRA
jgi:dTDP-4-amino-4,6-dideoxygalactose transaminase